MRMQLCAVGKLRSGPERSLTDDYMQRFNRIGRPLGLGPLTEHEVEPRKGGGIAAGAGLLARVVPEAAVIVALDERGRMLSSPELAQHIAEWRDGGRQDMAFVIGGADGIAAELRSRADLVLSFGPMVWPHLLVRVMLAEQIYRAATILSGSPYHRL